MAFLYSIAHTENHYRAISELNEKNLRRNINHNTLEDGFVTLGYKIGRLKELANGAGHVIVCHDDNLIGYAILVNPSQKAVLPELTDLFAIIEGHENIDNVRSNFCIMGQICIDSQYRGKGIFRKLYDHFFKYASKVGFHTVYTEVSDLNKRSLNAHLAIGFEIVEKHNEWNVLRYQIVVANN